MVAAFQSGRDIWREKYIKDLASYLLTLPVSRRVFALSRITGGVARSVVATFPGTLVISYLYGILFSPRLVEAFVRSEEHTSELQSQSNLVCRLLLEKKKMIDTSIRIDD